MGGGRLAGGSGSRQGNPAPLPEGSGHHQGPETLALHPEGIDCNPRPHQALRPPCHPRVSLRVPFNISTRLSCASHPPRAFLACTRFLASFNIPLALRRSSLQPLPRHPGLPPSHSAGLSPSSAPSPLLLILLSKGGASSFHVHRSPTPASPGRIRPACTPTATRTKTEPLACLGISLLLAKWTRLVDLPKICRKTYSSGHARRGAGCNRRVCIPRSFPAGGRLEFSSLSSSTSLEIRKMDGHWPVGCGAAGGAAASASLYVSGRGGADSREELRQGGETGSHLPLRTGCRWCEGVAVCSCLNAPVCVRACVRLRKGTR